MLEDQCRRPDSSIHISLLSIDRIRYRVQSWEQAKAIITEALMKKGDTDAPLTVDVSDILKQIEDGIIQYRGCDPDIKATIDLFRSLMKNKVREFTGGVHAETILAMFASCCSARDLEEREGGLELARVRQVSHPPKDLQRN